VILVPADVWRVADARGWTWGYLNLRQSVSEGVTTIVGLWDRENTAYPVDVSWQRGHITSHADIRTGAAVWYRSQPELHDYYDDLQRRLGTALPLATFRPLIPQGWVTPPVDRAILVVAYTEVGAAQPLASVWRVDRVQAAPVEFSIVDDQQAPLDFVAKEWPVARLSEKMVTVVGVGSIGSMIVDTLASAGVGELHLVDYDRLEQRNLARHRLQASDLGRLKVRAMKDYVGERYPASAVHPYPVSVVAEADLLRPVFAESDVIVCASDGVASRRVVNHLARRAGRPLVLAAVLEDGAFGEVIRVNPSTGCLFCLRLHQIESETLDPEPGLDLGYGTGNPHRPMTAAPSDLIVVGTFAAKVALATLLTRVFWHQQLPGDFALIGLQPTPDMPSPFGITRACDVRWHDLPASRPDCPTCARA
jgi:molybdopterin/thiamine biosynthesis adenylyltransferase